MSEIRHLIVVLGMHRSGTSLICQFLEQLGLSFPNNSLSTHEFDNPLDYFEAQEVVQLNNSFLNEAGVSWHSTTPLDKTIFQGAIAANYRKKISDYIEHSGTYKSLVLKDSRLCRLLPLWQPVLEQYFDEIKYICIFRHPLAVVQSLSKKEGGNPLEFAAITCPYHSLNLWLRYNLDLMIHSEGSDRILLAHESLVTSPDLYLKRLSQFLNIDYKSVTNKLTIDTKQVQEDIIHRKENSKLHPQTLDYYKNLYQGLIHGKFLSKDIEWLRNYLDKDFPNDNVFFKSTDFNDAQLYILRKGGNKELIAKTHGRVNRLYWSTPQQLPQLDVLFISHDATSRGHIYRVKNICDALIMLQVKAAWIEISDLDDLQNLSKNVKNVVIFRCENSTELDSFITECHEQSVRIIYDIDDFVFDTTVIDQRECRYIAGLPDTRRNQWLKRFDNYRQAMCMADIISVPTHTLQNFSLKFHKNSVVFPNTFDSINKQICDLALTVKLSRSDTKITLGYISGTPTHEHDFLTIKTSIIKILSLHPNVQIKIIGHLMCINDADFDPFRERIRVTPVVQHTALPFELVDFDINLIPLERNRFTDSKSELKFFESALLKIPTIAVANPVYKKIIRQGQNGYLAEDEKDWLDVINRLIEKPELRVQIGKEAYNTAIQLYDIEKLAIRYKQDILAL